MTKPNEPDPRLADKLSDEPKNESPAESDPGDGSSNADPDSENDTPERRTPERKLPDSVPVFARPRLGERDFIAYSSTRSSQLTGAPERSEARYVPQAPKLYMPPSSAGGEEHEANFPEVPADTWRLFVAIEIPRALKREFMDLAQSFRPR
ncbi:MAG: hypothetical protein O3B95_00240 [Chloroflexi bacterium]|nr:hypothetical protein [Chloroflexota bacterium]